VRYQIATSGPAFSLGASSDDPKRPAGRVVGFHHTCMGASVFQLDTVLLPCDVSANTLVKSSASSANDTSSIASSGGNATKLGNVTMNILKSGNAAGAGLAGLLAAPARALLAAALPLALAALLA
jgi:hypothetical protein